MSVVQYVHVLVQCCCVCSFLCVITDPYAVVSFGTQSQLTECIEKTLSPMWDQTLIFDEITLYGPPELVQQNPPECVVEVFDKDMIVSVINFFMLPVH